MLMRMDSTRPAMPKRPNLGLCLLLAAAAAAFLQPAHADAGMWTFEHPPLARIEKSLGVGLTPEWLARLQSAAVNYGASASFVSPRGLMLTNHHVAMACLQKLSTAGADLVARGFVATRLEDELRCPGDGARVLVSSEDVTAAVAAASAAGRTDEDRNARRKAEQARIEADCARSTALQCEVVALYSGAVHRLMRFRQWDDVRLVFAPEFQAGSFGGDADNFVYPRFALDAALFRVYENGQPVQPAAHLSLASQPLAEGDAVFVAGHPGETERLLTLAQLTVLRDVDMPLQLASAQRQQQLLTAYSARSPEAARSALDRLAGTENWLKAMRGANQALQQAGLMATKAADESAFRAAYAKQGLAGDPWREIEAAVKRRAARAKELWAVGYGYRTLFDAAGTLVELAHERRLPEARRLARYADSKLPALERRLRAEVPVDAALETEQLASLFDEARSLLGEGHPAVRAMLDGRSPREAAEAHMRGSRVADVELRRALLDGGLPAVEASADPMILLARRVYPLRRELARFEEEQVNTPIERAAQALGQARFALFGHDLPPDATGTLRLSFGRVAGYVSNGITMPWKSTWGGWLARADSFDQRPPFDLPPRVAASRAQVPAGTPLNFVLTADITGGSSGSPVVNQRGEWVGVIFDNNLEALGNGFVYSDATARSVAVHADAVIQALERVYAAPSLAAELRGGR